MTQPPHIPPSAILAGLEPAWRGMAQRLFRPFDAAKWLAVGFTAWLAVIGEQAGTFRLRLPLDWGASAREAEAVLRAHAPLLIGLGALVAVAGLALLVALLWVRCRGRFMFLDNVVRDRAAVARPWADCRATGQSLFWWSLGFGIVAWLFLVLAFAPAVALAISALRTHAWGRSIAAAVGITLPLLLGWLVVVSYVRLYLHDFIVPIMHRHGLRATDAWRRFGALWAGSGGTLLLYGLFRMLLALVLSTIIVAACLLSCCCLFLLLLVPYVHAVVLLPVHVFLRLYALEFLRHAGPDYDLLAARPPALPPAL